VSSSTAARAPCLPREHTALLVTLSPAPEEGKQRIKPWKLSRAQQRLRSSEELNAFLFTWERAWAHEESRRNRRCSRGPASSSRHGPAEPSCVQGAPRTDLRHGHSAPCVPQKASPSLRTPASQGGATPSLGAALGSGSVGSLLWGSRTGEERARKKSGSGGELQTGP